MGNIKIRIIIEWKGTPDVDIKNALVFNDEEAFAGYKAEMDNNQAAKSQFEAILAQNTNDQTIDSFWES